MTSANRSQRRRNAPFPDDRPRPRTPTLRSRDTPFGGLAADRGKRAGGSRIAVLGVAAIGAAIWYASSEPLTAGTRRPRRADAASAADAPTPALRPTPVVAAPVRQGTLDVYLFALGTVTPSNAVIVRSRVDGQLMKVAFEEGQMVKAGDLLAQIDPRPFEVQLTQANGQLARDQALLENAQVDLERYRTLLAQDSIRQAAGRHAGVAGAPVRGHGAGGPGQRSTARSCSSRTRGSSPRSPAASACARSTPATSCAPSDANGIVVITQLSADRRACSRSPRTTLPRVMKRLQRRRSHRRSTPTTARRRKSSRSGRLLTADNQIDTATGTVKLKAEFANADGALFPNQFVNVRMLVETLAERDARARRRRSSAASPGTFVYVVKDDKTVDRDAGEARPDAGRGHGRSTSGVAPGEMVVVDGADRLREGAKVEVVTRDAQRSRRRPTRRGADRAARAAARAAATRRGEGAQRRRRKGRRLGALTAPPMNPSRLFILRPVATSLLMVAILLAGIVAYRVLPLSALPEVDYPTIQVVTLYPGASPDVMTSSITAPLERQFGQMPGLNQMSSTSSGGASVITLQFSLELPLDVAEQEVQAAINAAGNFLPTDLPKPPIYNKVNPADAPILTLALTSQTMPLPKIQDLADTRLAQKISQLPGVGLVSISGGQRPAVRIQANPKALAAYGLSLDDLRTAIANANVNQAKGSFDGPTRASTIDANDQLKSADEYRQLIIAYRNGAPVRLQRRRRRRRRRREHAPRRVGERHAGDHPQHPAPAGRQRHRGGRPHQGAAAAARRRRCRPRSTSRC